MKRKKSEAMR